MAISGASFISAVSNGNPTAGVDEVQGLTTSGTVTSGTFKLSFQGFVTPALSWTATTSIIETALNNLKSIGAGGTGLVGVVVTGGAFPGTALVVTFSGTNVAKTNQGMITLHSNDLVGGGTVVITESTAGVTVFGRGLAPGSQVLNGAAGTVFANTGTALQPIWSAV